MIGIDGSGITGSVALGMIGIQSVDPSLPLFIMLFISYIKVMKCIERTMGVLCHTYILIHPNDFYMLVNCW